MGKSKDATEPIRKKAASLANEPAGKSCNQSSFKAGKGSFLFIGPGAKGIGYKAMFKLKDSIPQAKKLSLEEPDRFEVGKTGWVTARFDDKDPLPKALWEKWLLESFSLCSAPSKKASTPTKKRVPKKAKSTVAAKKKSTAKKSSSTNAGKTPSTKARVKKGGSSHP